MIRPWSEDLYEQEYYLDVRWKEIRDDDQFHESVLHIFREEEEYLHSIDGNISKGVWRLLPKSNTMILERLADDAVVTSELYDLAFLNNSFFVLKKHGIHSRKYFMMAREPIVRNLEWKDVMELMFNSYRNNSQFIVFVVVIVLILAVILVFSFW